MMTKFLYSLITTCTIALLASTSTQAQMNIIWADTLEKTFQTTCTDEEMMGSAISIMFSDNSIWSSAHGYHGSSTPLTTDMLYDMGSSSKTMIASLIFMLEDEDLLSIEDTIYSYITPIQNIPFGIRIKHLMGHTSGVFSYTNHPNFGPTINNDKSKFWHPDSILATFLNPPNFAIGTHYSYSNTGYILLGKVIESIEKKPLNQVLAERIFNPLRLKHMYLDQYDTYSEVKTGAWLSESNYYDGNYVSFMSSAWAAGGIVTKPEDCARYAHALGSGQLFEGNVTNRVFSNCNELSSSEWYGYGLIKTIYNNHVYLGHDGRTIQNAEMEYSVDSEFSLVVLNLDYDYYYEVRRLKFEMLDLVEYIEATNNSLLDTINAR